jgi:hypothetical protein
VRHGGPRYWAKALGLRWESARGSQWSDERIRAELTEYLTDATVWPPKSQFRTDGRGRLRDAVRGAGGPERWATELQLELPATRSTHRPWTYTRMKDELAAFASGRSDWPARVEFIENGLMLLYQKIGEAQARQRLAADLGLSLPEGRTKIRRRHWTDDRIYQTLEPFLRGRDAWPTKAEFRQVGLSTLYGALNKQGRRDYWARHFGLRPLRAGQRARG